MAVILAADPEQGRVADQGAEALETAGDIGGGCRHQDRKRENRDATR
jgi:hypothetical protein